MEAKAIRRLKPGNEYNHLIKAAKHTDTYLLDVASVFDTIRTIKMVVKDSHHQVAGLAQVLKGSDLKSTLQRIWSFVYDHIQYKIDKPGTEQVRSPARSWADRVTGVDCDCYSTFISALLVNLGIDHVLRMTAYRQHNSNVAAIAKPWQHVYVIVVTNQEGYKANPTDPSNYIVLDCVKDEFNTEHGPITAFKDYPMNLARLDGVDGAQTVTVGIDDFTIDGLGRITRRRGKRTKETVATVSADSAKVVAPVPVSTTPAPAPALHQMKPVEPKVIQRKGQEAPGTREFVPGVRSITRTQTVTENSGQLKNGTKVGLGAPDKERYFNNIFPGSSNGFTYYDRELLYNDRPSGHKLMRFWIVDGVLKGHNTKGEFFTDFGNGVLQRIQGVKVWNPGVALGSIGTVWQVDEAGNLTSSLNGSFDVYGMMIDVEVVRRALANRKERLGNASIQGLNGLAALAEILGPHLDNPRFAAEVASIPMGYDDLSGICGLSGGLGIIDGLEDINGLAEALDQSTNDPDSVITIDGLGRVRRGRVRRAAAKRTSTKKPGAAQAEVTTEEVPAAKTRGSLPLYIPANTLRNLLALRALHIQRLNKNGHKFTNELSMNGLGGTDGIDGLGFLQNVWKGIQNTFSSQNLLRMGAAATSLIPVVGGAVSSVVSPLMEQGIAADNARGDIERMQQQAQQPAPQAPIQPLALSTGQQSAPQAPTGIQVPSGMGQEDTAAYNAAAEELNGLGNTAETKPGIIDWVKKNPGTTVALVAAGGYLAYSALSGSSKTTVSRKGLGGVKRRKTSKKSGSKRGTSAGVEKRPFSLR